MQLRPGYIAPLVVTALAVACESRMPQPVTPSSVSDGASSSGSSAALLPPAAALQFAAPLAGLTGALQQSITMSDACDPETFNAVLGSGACIRSGGVQFDKFLEQVEKHHKVGAWHFAPGGVTLKVGQTLVAENHGGEAHTFTEVEEFGGGFVTVLNERGGFGPTVPECMGLPPSTFIQPGQSKSEVETEAGVEKYQCCFHPWMRAEIRIVEK